MNNRILIIVGAILIVLFVWKGLSRSDRTPKQQTSTIEPTVVQAKLLHEHALKLVKDGQSVEAKKLYKRVFDEYPDYEKIEEIQKELEELNFQIIFSNTPTEQSVIHEVQSGDTLGELASRYGTTIDLIKKSNRLSSDIIRIGQRLRIWTGTFNILIDKSQNILILKDSNDVIKVYHVSTGDGGSTPIGEFTITTKLIDPVWFNRGVVVPSESPQNVLGSRWLGFDNPGYGIHGTIDPKSIGRHVTAGCIRMNNQDVEELYSLVPTGTQVTIID